MIDENITETLREISELIKSDAFDRLKSHMSSLYRKIEDLTTSRDNWRRKFEEVDKRDEKTTN